MPVVACAKLQGGRKLVRKHQHVITKLARLQQAYAPVKRRVAQEASDIRLVLHDMPKTA